VSTAIRRLFALEQFGIKLGLEAMRVLLDALGAPERRWRAVHVAGTNGKGSASAMIERALREAGLRTGRYTSPHLHRLEERIAIAGRDVTTATLEAALARTFVEVDRLVAAGTLAAVPTFFEVSTAAAFLVFAEADVDVAVVEVGLGGRHDATNVLAPTVTAITSIAFDHERHLGTTLAAIAREKAGIAKAGVPLVVGEVADEAWQTIDAAAREVGAPVTRAAEATLVEAPLWAGHARLRVETSRGRYGPVRLALAGAHQVGNALVAIAVLEAWGVVTGRPVPPAAVEAGLAHVVWPARLEWLRRSDQTGGRVLVDAAHNPAGAAALASYLEMAEIGPVTLITSVMADKEVAGILRPLLPHVRRVVVTQAQTPRAMAAAELACQVEALAPAGLPVVIEADPRRAVARGLQFEDPVVLAGSIYLVGPLRAALVDDGFESA
jgi:dihydrofolate synthase / folylpolyglutamate synthase